MSEILRDISIINTIANEEPGARPLFDRLGGRPTLDRAHRIFYDKLFADPWLKQFFAGIDQKIIESQQSDFFSRLTGGPSVFSGRMPIDAHQHMFITEELFDHRHALLRASLEEAQIPDKERTQWLNIDLAFKKVLIKSSVDDCKKRYNTDEILNFSWPNARKAS